MLNIQKIRQSHRRFLSAHDSAVARSLDDARNEGIAFVQREPGFKPRTGELQRATTGQIVRTSRGSVIKLQNRKPYAGPIDKGSPRHPIAARSKALRFTSSAGVLIFRRRVNHPGNKPYRFLSRATTAAAGTFVSRMRSRMTVIARNF